MTNWPNIQEYRNFEAKFQNDSISYEEANLNDTSEGIDSIRVHKVMDYENWTSGRIGKPPSFSESKTVRCVIKNDFEENLKKLDRGDGLALSQQENSLTVKLQENDSKAISEAMTERQTIADQIRFQNHLKWMKQKEEEYAQKKIVEKLVQRRQKEEETRLIKLKKEKDREREVKLKEWLEQKEREKEGKKREKFVMKVLEEEYKDVTPIIDKEKLIENWVKLKDKQRQIEAEKRAEIQKREEENRALRQSLAALSYKQWKEKVKGKNMTLPKNGYQIFGPKPVPVVKEDWNHNFTRNSPRRKAIDLVVSRSNTMTNISSSANYQSSAKDFENQSKELFYVGDLKSRSSSFYHLKSIKSGINLNSSTIVPFKELQPETIGLKKTCVKADIAAHNCLRREMTFGAPNNFEKQNVRACSMLLDSLYSPVKQEDLKTCISSCRGNSEISKKKKIDLYIDPLLIYDDNISVRSHKAPTILRTVQDKYEKKESGSKTNDAEKEKESKTKLLLRRAVVPVYKKNPPLKVSSEAHINQKISEINRHTVKRFHEPQLDTSKTKKIHRRSKSCGKPVVKISKENVEGKINVASKSLGKLVTEIKAGDPETKTQTSSNSKRHVRKLSKPSSAEAADKRKPYVRDKSKTGVNTHNSTKNCTNLKTGSPEKSKKKTAQSFSFVDSPYNVKKTSSKHTVKSKVQSKKKLPLGTDNGENRRCETEKWSNGKTS